MDTKKKTLSDGWKLSGHGDEHGFEDVNIDDDEPEEEDEQSE